MVPEMFIIEATSNASDDYDDQDDLYVASLTLSDLPTSLIRVETLTTHNQKKHSSLHRVNPPKKTHWNDGREQKEREEEEQNENRLYHTLWNVMWRLGVMADNQLLSVELNRIGFSVADNCRSRVLVSEHDVSMLRATITTATLQNTTINSIFLNTGIYSSVLIRRTLHNLY